MSNLKDKLSRVKDEHAAELVDQRGAESDETARHDALFFLGRVKQNEHLAVAISTNLTAQTIRALEHFQSEGLYKNLGYQTFVDFLDKSEYSPMSKRQYYDRLALIREHGDEIYDLLTSVGISVRASKMLGKGDLAIKGDQLVIGDKPVELANAGVIKEVLEELFDERRELQATAAKKDKKIEEQAAQIRHGQAELEEKERALDAIRSGNPYDNSLTEAFYSLGLLAEKIGDLPDAEKAEKSGHAMRMLWQLLIEVRKAFGSNFRFEDVTSETSSTSKTSEPSLAEKVLAEDDDFGDDEEVSPR